MKLFFDANSRLTVEYEDTKDGCGYTGTTETLVTSWWARKLKGTPGASYKAPSEEEKCAMSEYKSIFGFTIPFSSLWLLSLDGSEYFHCYLWILKDIAWTQSWRHFALGDPKLPSYCSLTHSLIHLH